MRLTLTCVAATAALTANALVTPALAYGAHDGTRSLRAVGLAENGTRLVAFSTSSPGLVTQLGRISGLRGDTRLVGIDRRVQDGRVYGVGNAGGLYALNADGRAVRTRNPALPLDGSLAFGVDFNPAANALRVISSRGQNLRVPFATAGAAAVVDSALTRPGATPGTTDRALDLTGAAYTNNDLLSTTATTLFDIDTQRDQVTIQAPANAGSTSPTGSLGFDARKDTGFDIYTASDGDLAGFAVTAGRLYTVDLLSGDADGVGQIGSTFGTVSDLALPVA